MKDPAQEQFIAARRQHILDVAAQVFAAKGYHLTTIKDIARAAGMADGTIYNYFENKGALLLGIFARLQAAILQEAGPPPPANADPHTLISAYLRQPLLALTRDHFALLRVVIAEVLVNDALRQQFYQQIMGPMIAQTEPLLQHWMAQHGIQTMPAPLLARTLASLLLGVVLEQIISDRAPDATWEALPDTLTILLLEGLQPKTP